MMKKPITIQLSIPEPCTQGWDAMQTVQGGRHCASCQKVVTDFSRMTDAQLLDYFHKYEGSCGRFTAEQLDRVIKAVEVPRSNWWARIAAGVLLMLGLSKNAEAQNYPSKKVHLHQAEGSVQPKQETAQKATCTGVISGMLKDGRGNEIVNAVVELYRDTLKLAAGVTDFDGKYSFKDIPAGTYTLKFTYQNHTEVINKIKLRRQDVDVAATMHIPVMGLMTIIVNKQPRPLPEPPGQHTFRAGDNLPKNW